MQKRTDIEIHIGVQPTKLYIPRSIHKPIFGLLAVCIVKSICEWN